MRDNNRLKIKALHREFTTKFGTIELANCIINALIISRKIPKLKIVMGRVSTMSNGLTKRLRMLKINATAIAVKKLLISTPGKISAIIIIPRLLINHLINVFILFQI